MKSKLYNLPDCKCKNAHPVLLRVIVNKSFTRLDFGYQATSLYTRGGWVTIAPETYLRTNEKGTRLKMIRAENIPVGPEKHFFESTTDRMYFSLIFEPLPAGTTKFDLIEKLPDTPTLFNFFGIKLKAEDAIELLEEQLNNE